MTDRRLERQRQRRRLLLERAMAVLEREGWEALDPLACAREAGLKPGTLRSLASPEDLFFPDHAETCAHLPALLEGAGLLEACLALARHQEELGAPERRRLALVEATPALKLRRTRLEADLELVLAAHFATWDRADAMGERSSAFQAAAVLAVLRAAERLWVEGDGRPQLPVLVHEALATLWPALYPRVRRLG